MSLHHRSPASAGFTLIEVLIYISILVLVSVAGVTTLISFSDILADQKTNRLLTQTAHTALERMVREVRNAESVDVLGSTLEDRNGVLELDTPNGAVLFSESGGALELAVGSDPAVTLVDGDVTVDGLWFYHYPNSETELVRIKLSVTATTGERSKSAEFYAGAVLRGSYE